MVHPDAIDPSVKARVPFEVTCVREGAEEGILENIQGIFLIVEEASQSGVQTVLIPVNQHPERFDVPSLKRFQQMNFICFLAPIRWTTWIRRKFPILSMLMSRQ